MRQGRSATAWISNGAACISISTPMPRITARRGRTPASARPWPCVWPNWAAASAPVRTRPPAPYNLPGGGLHLEMELMTRAGLSPLQALSAATGTAADILKRDDIGRIAVGRRADLLIVEGDPSRDIRDTRRLRHIVLDGRAYAPDALKRQAITDGEARLAALLAEEGD
ncbi:amidohydrolase family protein [Brevundimonas sp. ZS04]|uniref:amidohydrolase family protein n=1 Tax=Brevundimonas sp. ZS04 TaxID=1906854 RepID=UPI0009FA0E37